MNQRLVPAGRAGGAGYPVRITFEVRANVRASIGKRAVHIRVPWSFSPAERDDAVARMLAWARRTVDKRRLAPRPAWRAFADGERFSVDGAEYTLRLEERERRTGTARLEGGELRVVVPLGLDPLEKGRQVTLLASRCLARAWLPRMRDTVERVASRAFGGRAPLVRLKYLRASWGSCSRRGAINLSTRLLLAPAAVREYVCVHELAHLRERGHTPAFWRDVERVLPDWRARSRWLRANGDKLWF